jgi:hypothetical protein
MTNACIDNAFAYCHLLIKVFSFPRSHNDHIKWHLLLPVYQKMILHFFFLSADRFIPSSDGHLGFRMCPSSQWSDSGSGFWKSRLLPIVRTLQRPRKYLVKFFSFLWMKKSLKWLKFFKFLNLCFIPWYSGSRLMWSLGQTEIDINRTYEIWSI